MNQWPLSSEECELLCILENGGTLQRMSVLAKRDVSVLSRQLQKISEKAPVLEKIKGKWTLTKVGKDVVSWSKDAQLTLKRVFAEKTLLRIGATREFSARVLSPEIENFLKHSPGVSQISILTAESGVESMIINGEVDLGFDCGRPVDPLIAFRLIANEKMAVFCSPRFLKNKLIKNQLDLLRYPCLQYSRISVATYLGLTHEISQVSAFSNDLSVIRALCIEGLGWAILPFYAVTPELKAGSLYELKNIKISPERYGVWWLRGKPNMSAMVENACNWLKLQKI